MVNARFISAILALTGSSVVFSSPEGIQKYHTGLIPLSYGKCATLDLQVLAAFQNASGTQIISHQCVDGPKGSEIEISYHSSNGRDIQLTSTRYLETEHDLTGRGYIKKEEDCEARKSAITSQFTASTGLQPFFTRCMTDQGIDSSNHPWHVAIDAVGVGEMNYQFIRQSTSEGLSSDPKVFLQSVRDYLTTRDNTSVVDVTETLDGAAFGSVVISVFTKEKLVINSIEGTSNKLAADCAIEATQLHAAANSSGVRLMATGCVNKPLNGHMTKSLIEGHDRVRFESTGIKFNTVQDCRTKRPNTLADMRATLGDDVIAIMCSDKTNDVTAFVVLKPDRE